MKKLTFLIVAIISLTATAANAGIFGVSISTRARWSEAERACIEAPKGFCFHIEIGAPLQTNANLSNDNGLILTFSDKYTELLKDGKFYVEGEGTFSKEILKQLNLPIDFVLKEGYYKTEKINGSYKVYLK